MKKSISVILRENRFLGTSVSFIVKNILKIYRKFYLRKIKGGEAVILALHKLGDTVFTIPAVQAILEQYPDALVICYQDSKTIYDLKLKGVKYETFNKEDLVLGGRCFNKQGRNKLKEKNISAVFDLTCTILSASLLYNSRAERIVGFNDAYFEPIYTTFVKRRKTPNLVEMYKDIVRAGGISLKEAPYYYPANYNMNDKIIIHPFAGWAAKEWGLEKFIELTKTLHAEGLKVSWIFPRALSDTLFLEKLKNNNINYIITDNLDHLINEIGLSSLLISNDSGPVHIANVLGKPTFTIYGPTNPDFIKPEGEYHRSIQTKIACVPTGNMHYCHTDAGRFCPAYECMISLSVKEVQLNLKEFIKQIGLVK